MLYVNVVLVWVSTFTLSVLIRMECATMLGKKMGEQNAKIYKNVF